MAAPYPTDHPFEYYYLDGRNSRQIVSASKTNNNQHQPDLDDRHTLAIRRHSPDFPSADLHPSPVQRHTPASSSAELQPLPVRRNPETANASFTGQQSVSEPNFSSASVRNHLPAALDPDERPIKPMKNTSVYNKSSTQNKIVQPRKPSAPSPSPPKSSAQYEYDTYQIPPSPSKSSTRHEYDTYQVPPSRSRMSNISHRRPIRIDLIPKTPFGISPQRNRSRQIIVEEYDDDGDDDDDYLVTYVETIPEKVISYKQVSGMTTRELENYQMSKPRRVVRVRSPLVETIIYRT